MVEVKRIDTPESEKTKIYIGSLMLAWIPFVGLILALNGLIRSIIKISSSRKKRDTDKRAVMGFLSSFAALTISIFAINATINPTPSVELNNNKDKITTDSDKYTFIGTVKKSKDGKLTINGVGVSVINENFSHEVSLQEGDNIFTIVATNNNGSSKKSIKIYRLTKAELQARANEPKHSFDDFYNWIIGGSGHGDCGAGSECANWAYIDNKCSLYTRKTNNELVSYFNKECLQGEYKKYMKPSAFDIGTSKDHDKCESDITGYYHYLCSRFGDMIMAIRSAASYKYEDESRKHKQDAERIYSEIALTKGGS